MATRPLPASSGTAKRHTSIARPQHPAARGGPHWILHAPTGFLGSAPSHRPAVSEGHPSTAHCPWSGTFHRHTARHYRTASGSRPSRGPPLQSTAAHRVANGHARWRLLAIFGCEWARFLALLQPRQQLRPATKRGRAGDFDEGIRNSSPASSIEIFVFLPLHPFLTGRVW